MIRPADLSREHLRVLLSQGARLAHAARLALEPEGNLAACEVCCEAGTRIADLLDIRAVAPADAPAAKLVDVETDAAETLDMDVED